MLPASKIEGVRMIALQVCECNRLFEPAGQLPCLLLHHELTHCTHSMPDFLQEC